MRAEFFRPDAPERVIGSARWDGRRATIEADDEAIRTALGRVFRPSSVATSDSAVAPAEAPTDTEFAPGDLRWFQAAARVRGEEEGLTVRLVSETPGGWDPAGSYRPMETWNERREGHATRGDLGTSRA
jgi:hypothetical protein